MRRTCDQTMSVQSLRGQSQSCACVKQHLVIFVEPNRKMILQRVHFASCSNGSSNCSFLKLSTCCEVMRNNSVHSCTIKVIELLLKACCKKKTSQLLHTNFWQTWAIVHIWILISNNTQYSLS